MSLPRPAAFVWCTLLATSACACGTGAAPGGLAAPDGGRFARDVYPVLLRDCGMAQCHGAPNRFFRIFGPGRTRLSSDTALLDPATAQEILESYNRTRSMLELGSQVQKSLLLRKPLALAAGGATHEGSDAYGRNVYLSKDAPGYVTLTEWALGSMPKDADP